MIYRNSNGAPHRVDGPAVIWWNGDTEWYVNGQRHRDDGPAYEDSEERKWYKNGKRHREDGPAVECLGGFKEWWLNDCIYSFEGWLDALEISVEEKMILILKYR